MEYLGFWVTRNGVKFTETNTSIKKYEDTNLPKISTTVYRCIELLPRYVGNTFTYIITFK